MWANRFFGKFWGDRFWAPVGAPSQSYIGGKSITQYLFTTNAAEMYTVNSKEIDMCDPT